MSTDALNAPIPAVPVIPAAVAATPESFELYKDVPKAKMVPVKLLRNYRPAGEYEVIGYHKEPKFRKDVTGKMIEVEKGGFIKETDPETGKIIPAPPPLAGIGVGARVWSGTVIKLPADEAKTVRKNGIGEIEIDDD